VADQRQQLVLGVQALHGVAAADERGVDVDDRQSLVAAEARGERASWRESQQAAVAIERADAGSAVAVMEFRGERRAGGAWAGAGWDRRCRFGTTLADSDEPDSNQRRLQARFGHLHHLQHTKSKQTELAAVRLAVATSPQPAARPRAACAATRAASAAGRAARAAAARAA